MDNLEETDKLLDTYNLLRLNQEKTENLNKLITINEIEAVIKKLPKNRSPGLDGFTGEFYQRFKEKLTSILLNYSKNFKRRLPSSFYETALTSFQNQIKTLQIKKIIVQYPR